VPQPKLILTRRRSEVVFRSIRRPCRRKKPEVFLGIAAHLLHHLIISSPAAIGRRTVRPKAGPIRHPFRASLRMTFGRRRRERAIRRLPRRYDATDPRIRYGAQRSSVIVVASAAATIGNSCALVPIAPDHCPSHATRVGAGGRRAQAFLEASTHQRCHRKPWRRAVPKSERRKPSSWRSRSTLLQACLGAGIKKHRGQSAPVLFITWR